MKRNSLSKAKKDVEEGKLTATDLSTQSLEKIMYKLLWSGILQQVDRSPMDRRHWRTPKREVGKLITQFKKERKRAPTDLFVPDDLGCELLFRRCINVEGLGYF